MRRLAVAGESRSSAVTRRRGDLDRQTLETGVVEQAANAVDVDFALTMKDERLRDDARVSLLAWFRFGSTALCGDQRRNGAGVRRAASARVGKAPGPED